MEGSPRAFLLSFSDSIQSQHLYLFDLVFFGLRCCLLVVVILLVHVPCVPCLTQIHLLSKLPTPVVVPVQNSFVISLSIKCFSLLYCWISSHFYYCSPQCIQTFLCEDPVLPCDDNGSSSLSSSVQPSTPKVLLYLSSPLPTPSPFTVLTLIPFLIDNF